MSTNKCTCNDERKIIKKCFHCKSEWKEEMPHHYKIANCPLHRLSIAICGVGPELCGKCINDGYYVELESGSMLGSCGKYIAKEYKCTCDNIPETKKMSCLDCKAEWQEDLSPEERLNECMKHGQARMKAELVSRLRAKPTPKVGQCICQKCQEKCKEKCQEKCIEKSATKKRKTNE